LAVQFISIKEAGFNRKATRGVCRGVAFSLFSLIISVCNDDLAFFYTVRAGIIRDSPRKDSALFFNYRAENKYANRPCF
jgi:hypothetical protein